VSPLDRYSCEEVFRRIDDFLDRELRPSEVARVRAHLETCGACASEFAFEETILLAVRAKLQRVDVPSELRHRIALRLAAARASPTTDC
jgi:anti-sigma factor (TIGR02949 family)